MPGPAPYSSDARARGWRFELDYEQIEQSDTWAIAAETPMAQHALLMLWLAAWTQVPCGSLPNDDQAIRAKCRVPPKLWATMRDVVMRGWWAADDGRLYHPTLTKRVEEMMTRRRSDSDRKAKERAKKAAETVVIPAGVPSASHVTPPGLHRESSTDNRLPNTNTEDLEREQQAREAEELARSRLEREGFAPTPGGAACRAIRQAGIADANPGHAGLLRLIEGGVTAEELASTAEELVLKGKGKFALLLATVEGRRKDAADAAAVPVAPAKPVNTQADDTSRMLAADRAREAELSTPESRLLVAQSIEAARRRLTGAKA